MAKAARIDWKPIKTEYITTSKSHRELAEKYGISRSAIGEKSKEEQWVKLREKYQAKCVARARQKASDKEVNRLERLIAATSKAIDVAMEAFEDEKQFNRYIVTDGIGEGATVTTEREFAKVDTKALKDLTGVLKDLTGLMRDFYNIPTPAQAEAQRIAAARLEIDRKKAEDSDAGDGSVEVVFSGGMERYAR